MVGFELGKGPLEGETDEEFERRMKREKVVEEVASWIDTRVIAEMVVDYLEDAEQEVTVANCQDVWLRTLENLGGGVGLATSSKSAQ